MTTALLLMAIVVLFNHLGLRESVEGFVGYKFKVLGCSKCGTFWLSLISLIAEGTSLVESLALSFAMAYAALWLELLLAIMSKCYESTYDKISKAETDSDATVVIG